MDYIPRIHYDAGAGTVQVNFTYPAEGDPFEEVAKAVNVTAVSASGAIQNNQLYQEEIRKIKVKFVSKTVTDLFRTFFEAWGSKKESFTYYPHTDVTTDNYSATLEDNDIAFKRILPGASSDFLYEFDFTIRRVK